MTNRYIDTLKLITSSIYVLILGIAIFHTVSFIVNSMGDLLHPYSLYWYEDESLYTVKRILKGEGMYVDPSVEYVPFIYPPLYYYFAAIISLILGEGFFPLRLLSFAATVGTMLIIYRYVFQHARSKGSAVIAVGFYAGFYPFVKMWFNLARIDTLAISLIIAALYVLDFYRTRAGLIISALLLFLACLTKQTALVVFLVVCMANIKNKDLTRYFILPFVIMYSLSVIFFQWYSSGWYGYYLFYLPSGHLMKYTGMIVFLTYDLIIGTPFVLPAFFIPGAKQLLLRYKSLIAVGVIYSVLGRLNLGGDSNSSLLLYVTFAIYVGFMSGGKFGALYKDPHRNDIVKNLVLGLFVFFQMIWFSINFYNQSQHTMSKKYQKKEAEKIIDFIKSTRGKIYMSNHRDLLRVSGKSIYLHLDSLRELLFYYGKGKSTIEAIRLRNEMAYKLRNKEFSALIIDSAHGSYAPLNPLLDEMRENYQITEKYFELSNDKYYVYLPK